MTPLFPRRKSGGTPDYNPPTASSQASLGPLPKVSGVGVGGFLRAVVQRLVFTLGVGKTRVRLPAARIQTRVLLGSTFGLDLWLFWREPGPLVSFGQLFDSRQPDTQTKMPLVGIFGLTIKKPCLHSRESSGKESRWVSAM